MMIYVINPEVYDAERAKFLLYGDASFEAARKNGVRELLWRERECALTGYADERA